MDSHEEFLELCAVSTSGDLTEGERKRLEEHLAGCSSCREALKEYESAVASTVPSIASELAQEAPTVDPSWSMEKAEAAFFKRLEKEEEASPPRAVKGTEGSNLPVSHRPAYHPPTNWNHMWMLYAAGILLCAALGIAAYRIGMRRGGEVARLTPPVAVPNPVGSIPEQLTDAGHEHAQLVVQMMEQGKVIADLRHQVQEESAEINRLKGKGGIASAAPNSGQGDGTPPAEATHSSEELKAAQTQMQEMQKKLDAQEAQRSEMLARSNSLEAKVGDLTDQLHQREGTVDQQSATIADQRELLEHDRDIRDLMGARDLYIVEVYDVARTGKTNKPYGRVFYTKGKSLIFYAYDLDQQTGLKNASTFQAWGRRGPDKEQALNLGIFYVDNTSKKRWVLKSTDPKTLEEIDAVFVTIEPNGGSHHPSGKQLLFASLRINPNHP